ncbi:hypothetical protein [Streptomyces erythrochromogenes]|uniref:hypothetical protein n=1 Tax=Streptomyces erythrochromogenes TaxID=285574 RepID=UPI00386F393B|nr:hypothetical protein OG489_26295 [Streptomyces erythrochromogenes]
MEGWATGFNTAFDHVDHPLLHKQVRDPTSGRVGKLMAVCHETLGYVEGGRRTALTAYIRGIDGREFTAAATTVVAT